jgi:hypothetical protein
MDAQPILAWMSGRPKPLALFAAHLAVAAESCHEGIQNLRLDHSMWKPYSGRDHRKWLHYYSSNRLLLSELGRALGWREERIGLLIGMLKCFAWFSKAERANVQAAVREAIGERPDLFMTQARRRTAFYERIAIRSLTSEEAIGFFGDVDPKRFFQDPAAQFFFRVAFPCLMLFGQWPSLLLNSATKLRNPNHKKLSGLIRLDKHVVSHPRVRRLMLSGPKAARQRHQGVVAQSLRSMPPIISRKKIKSRLGRLIIDVCAGCDYRLTTTDVANLFHAVAKSNSLTVDRDIPQSPEARTKGIQREKRFWSILPYRTKKR